MNLSQRISTIMVLIATITMCLLTVLMHFKYHTTNSTLINERLDVTGRGIVRILQSGLKLGVNLEHLKEITNQINKIKAIDKTIKDIVILKVNFDELTPIFCTDEAALSASNKRLFLHAMRGSKTPQWKGKLDKSTGFFGVTLLDAAKVERAMLLMIYDDKEIRSQENEEIFNLYKRLFFGLLIVAIMNYIAGYKNTLELSKIFTTAEKSILSAAENPKQKIDLRNVTDPVIRTYLRSMLATFSMAGNLLMRIESLIKQSKNNKDSGD